MALRHGIYGIEIPTKVVPPIVSDAGLPVVVGTAPIHLAQEPAEVNKPILIYNFEEAVRKFGYSEDWEKYTLCEFMYSQFVLYGRAPVVLINVLDVTKNKKEQTETLKLINGKGTLEAKDVIASTLDVKDSSAQTQYSIETDYLLTYDNDGKLTISAVSDKIKNSTLKLTFSVVDTAKITKKEIIGGVDITTGKKSGLELINEVYPRYMKVPGTILAPGWSSDPEVATIMNSKAARINGIFQADALIDAPSHLLYSEVPEWKKKNNIVEKYQLVIYPKLSLGGKTYHFSTQLAGSISATDAKYEGIPYKSPSNENLRIDSTVNDNGEVFLSVDEANYLNENGIMTAINFAGWKTWGNRTAAYPTTSDVKDSFIPIRRMFNWAMNTMVLTFWSKIDDPINKRLIETVVDTANLWLNGLASQGAILGGRVAFEEADNPVTSLMDGKIKFHFYLTPPSPAEEISFVQEYDVNIVQAFIAEMSSK